MTNLSTNKKIETIINKKFAKEDKDNYTQRKLLKKIAHRFARLQYCVDQDYKCLIYGYVGDIYYYTLLANYMYYKEPFDDILVKSTYNTIEETDYILSLDKFELSRSIVKLLSDIKDDELTARNISLILVTIHMICIYYKLDFIDAIVEAYEDLRKGVRYAD